MAQIAKVEIEENVKSSPHLINEFFIQNSPQHSGGAVQARGLNNNTRSVARGGRCARDFKLSFTLNIGGMSVKLEIEAVNCWERSITFSLVEGELCKYYKSLKIKATFTGCRVKWSIEYEEVDYYSGCCKPDNFAVLVKEMTKALEANLFK